MKNRKQTQLELIRKALENNPDISIVHVKDDNYLPGLNKYGAFNHVVGFYVASRNGDATTAEKLQELMMSIIPEGVKPVKIVDFKDASGVIWVGQLFFEEEIGMEVVHRELVLVDEDGFEPAGFVGKKMTINQTNRLRRSVWIKVYPTTEVADIVLSKEDEVGCIYKRDFLK